MKEAVIPFLGYCLLQLFVAVTGLNLVREREAGFSDALRSWIFGQILLFGVLQLMAVPMILLRLKFDVLFWSYLCVAVMLFGIGLWRLGRGKTRIKMQKPQLNPLASVILVVTALLVLYQAGSFFFGMHLDEDDARWLAQANDALTYGDMLTRNFDTGEYLGFFQAVKDVSSPWPMMWAIAGRLLRVRPSVFAHTVYAPIEVLLMYGVYWLIGRELFDRIEARSVFIASVASVNLFFGGTVYTQSAFSLIRIWQGKATVAAVILPLLIYLMICVGKRDRLEDWVKLIVVDAAACLMSGMGVSLAAIVIVVLGAYIVLAFARFRRLPMLLLSVMPSAMSFLVYSAFQFIV